MGTDHRINAVTMAAALLGAVLLGGCSHTSYEKITVVETDAQQAEGTGKTEENLAAERIGESDAETGIILETEDQNAEDFSENAGESGQNLALPRSYAAAWDKPESLSRSAGCVFS